uniref:RING-type domain-containing protein n=1 Tax=Neobodo designis TaxID=312471 RepID=A0A7S1KYE5_NEODS|mmetsp:Transcript_11123/g.34532  ORF Transcript_11123/g.34532 Transcript_11123/m.34532 type:complete len:354 (+) Transcript_11123:155-1216(+)|eukprot:CAMPEP_0174853822 /NCGR_PEP_ID=MMETSP1114-20130205/29589_1 /TAXON_ID=312471 /ORGANISM="Neobodo designis, Strain CCAP 1951/1" /LENGTH=353 /DNA_ID=CAMNT_0016088489 /DNA_START=153 /DNA_END=1214 /DNA_ORIENTATION=+
MRRIDASSILLAVIAIVATVGQGANAVVACNTGFVEFACPDDYPTCCSWPNNGVVAACCPADAQCELQEGVCLVYNTSTRNVTRAPKEQGGITVGVSEAAAFITFAAIGFIVALVGCAFLGFRVFLFTERRRQARAEAERQALLADSDGEANDDGNDDDSEVDDEGQCNICYSRSVNCALMPCAHVATCRVCAARLDKCPICREDVTRFVAFKTRIYNAIPKSKPSPKPALRDDAKTEELGTTAGGVSHTTTPRTARQAGDASEGRAATPAPAEAADTDERPVPVPEAADASSPTAEQPSVQAEDRAHAAAEETTNGTGDDIAPGSIQETAEDASDEPAAGEPEHAAADAAAE